MTRPGRVLIALVLMVAVSRCAAAEIQGSMGQKQLKVFLLIGESMAVEMVNLLGGATE